MREEDDLRAALHTLERLTPDADRMLTAIRASGPPAPPPRPPRRWRRAAGVPRIWGNGWIVPLAAATAMIAVVGGSVVGARAFAPGRAGGRASRVSTTAAPFPTWDGLPAYFMMDSGPFLGAGPNGTNVGGSPASRLPHAQRLPIIATATGRAVATVRLPGYVTAISASAGAFFAAVVKDHAASFYEVRLSHSGTHATVTKLPIPEDTVPIEFMAASPDGSKLAFATMIYRRPFGVAQTLVVAATSTGAERRWHTPARDARGGNSMDTFAWLGDGKTLAFNWSGPTQASTGLRLLDTSKAGNNLLSGAFVLGAYNHVGVFSASFDGYNITPDGKTLLGVVSCFPKCGPGSPSTVRGLPDVPGSLIQFAAATKVPTVRYTEPELRGVPAHPVNSGCIDPMWFSASAHRVLLPCFQHRPGPPHRKGKTFMHILLLDGRKVTELPWLDGFVNGLAAFPGVWFDGATPSYPSSP